MRALLAPIALSALLAGSASAQAAKFITVDVVGKSIMHCEKGEDGPTEVHVRMPITFAKGLLDMAADNHHLKINGKNSKALKVDELVKLLEGSKPGDLLLELTTDKGDLVKISVQ